MFTDTLWQSIEGIYTRILEHPFIGGLKDGSLDEEAFKFYVVQDALYLQEYARGLALLGAKAEEDDQLILFCQQAETAIVVERTLHESFFAQWNLTDEEVYKTPRAPNNLFYTSYLLRVAFERPYHEGLGAFLPCYWIYLEVGKELEKSGSSNPLYQQWIETYSSEEFEDAVNTVKAVTNSVAERLTDAQREKMREHFIVTSKLEYLFWDMGYHRLAWPV